MNLSDKCLICDSEWGNYWFEINEESIFFCCEICAMQYKNLHNTIQNEIGTKEFKILKMGGNTFRRSCEFQDKNGTIRNIEFRFNSKGNLNRLKSKL